MVRTLTSDEKGHFLQEAALAQNEIACPEDEGVAVMDGTKLILETKVDGTYAVGQREALPGEPMLGLSNLLDSFAGWATRPGTPVQKSDAALSNAAVSGPKP